jgi:hypothetical protein
MEVNNRTPVFTLLVSKNLECSLFPNPPLEIPRILPIIPRTAVRGGMEYVRAEVVVYGFLK